MDELDDFFSDIAEVTAAPPKATEEPAVEQVAPKRARVEEVVVAASKPVITAAKPVVAVVAAAATPSASKFSFASSSSSATTTKVVAAARPSAPAPPPPRDPPPAAASAASVASAYPATAAPPGAEQYKARHMGMTHAEAQQLESQQRAYDYEKQRQLAALGVRAQDPGALKKHTERINANGDKWEDTSMAEWPENDYRLFVGDLGNEVAIPTHIR